MSPEYWIEHRILKQREDTCAIEAAQKLILSESSEQWIYETVYGTEIKENMSAVRDSNVIVQ